MTTRRFRGGGQGGKPNSRLGARARVLERDVTTTDVTQHSTEILTDQDFSITSPNLGDALVYNAEGRFINTKSFLGQMLFLDGFQINDGADGDPSMAFANAPTVGFYLAGSSVGVSGSFTVTGDPAISTQVGGGHKAIEFKNDANANQVDIRWTAAQDRLYFVPMPAGSEDFNNEFTFDFSDETWKFDDAVMAGTVYIGSTSIGFTVGDEGADRLEVIGGYFVIRNDQYIAFEDAAGTDRFALKFDTSDNFWIRNPVGDIEMRPNANKRAVFTSDLPLHLQGASGELLRLDDSSATGDPRMTFYQNGTSRAWVRYTDSISGLQFRNTEAGLYRFDKNTGARLAQFNESAPHLLIQGDGDEQLRLDHSSATGSPYLSFYQSGSLAAFAQYNDSVNSLRFGHNVSGIFEFRSGGNENIRVVDITGTGDPYISFYRGTTRGGYIQLTGGDRMRFVSDDGGGNSDMDWFVGGFQAMYLGPDGDLRMLAGGITIANAAGSDARIRITATGAAGPTGGHAYLELLGDSNNTSGEPGGAYVRFSTDGGLTEAMIGLSQSGAWPNRDTLSGVAGNDFMLGIKDNFDVHIIAGNAVIGTFGYAGDFTCTGDVIFTV